MRAIIFCGGPIDNYDAIRPYTVGADLIVTADAGARHCLALGLIPHLAVGDFDSGGPQLWAELRRLGVPVQSVPAEKDQTDSHLALQAALTGGATELVLLGATGGRLDHTLANILLLPGLPPGTTAVIADAKNEVRLLQGPGRVALQGTPGEYISLLPLAARVTGVSTEGLRYPLQAAELTWGESRGVSNEFTAAAAAVSAAAGALLIIRSRD